MSKHTPGPWEVLPYPAASKVFAGDMHVCDIRGWGYLTGVGGLKLSDHNAVAIQEANASLISAAPDLLEACKSVLAFLDKLEANTLPNDPLAAMRRAIHAPLRAKLEPAIYKAEAVRS